MSRAKTGGPAADMPTRPECVTKSLSVRRKSLRSARRHSMYELDPANARRQGYFATVHRVALSNLAFAARVASFRFGDTTAKSLALRSAAGLPRGPTPALRTIRGLVRQNGQ
jgi:hypothetical protein